jgi:hypothetical protein
VATPTLRTPIALPDVGSGGDGRTNVERAAVAVLAVVGVGLLAAQQARRWRTRA